jgi:sarcosine oxidase subunit beta
MSNNRRSFDIILIGAGSVGAPTAFYLSEAGFRILVIDQEPSEGQQSNKNAIGGIRATHSDPAKIRLCQRSLEIFSTWEQVHGDSIEWLQGGYCFVAYRQEEETLLMNLLGKQKDYHLKIDWLPAADLLQLVPDLNPRNLIGGTYSPEDGSASPLKTAASFTQHARRLGAQFNFSEKVQKIHQTSGQVTGLSTNRGKYSAPIIINAAGAEAREIAALVGQDLPVYPDSHEAAVTEPVATFLKPMVVDIRPLPGSSNFYFYQHVTGQILFCLTPSPNIWGRDTRETSTFLPQVAARLIEVMPRLKHLRVRRSWRGLYPMTPDGFPIVGWSQSTEGLLHMVGMCGQGFMLGPALGELAVRLVNQTTNLADLETLTYLDPARVFSTQEVLK